MNDFIELTYRRRSIRKFTEKAVSIEVLEELLKAAMAAPSAMNAQPWEFVVVTDPEILQKCRNALMFSKQNYTAVICVCGSPRVQKSKAGDRFWVQDCSAASENILLAATALGLGSVWIGVFPIQTSIMQVQAILNLPDDIIPLNLIGLGYPAETKDARTQYEESRVHWQTYGPAKKPHLPFFRRRKNETLLEKSKEDEE
jgi:nitroreductase